MKLIKIKEKLEEMYREWNIIFPQKIFEERKNGDLYINGWSFRYCFENINGKESIFIRTDHRMTDPSIYRIFENGEIESLTDFRISDREHNIKFTKELIERGFNKYVINGIDFYVLAFDIGVAPNNRKEFLEWKEQQMEWKEEHDYNNINISSNNLKNWYMDIINKFPPIIEDLENYDEEFEKNENNEYLTEYSIGKNIIYSIFNWRKAEEAFELIKILSEKHKIGFLIIEAYLEINEIYFPNGKII